jgi:hypothetical protein
VPADLFRLGSYSNKSCSSRGAVFPKIAQLGQSRSQKTLVELTWTRSRTGIGHVTPDVSFARNVSRSCTLLKLSVFAYVMAIITTSDSDVVSDW